MLRILCFLLYLSLACCTPYQIPARSPYAKLYPYEHIQVPTRNGTLKQRILNKKIKVTSVTMKMLPNERGFWTGLVNGEGEYQLYLNFYQGKQLIKSKRIGSRELTPKESPTWFKFNSYIPTNKKYSWKIEAYQ